jgi:riboflavin synthase
MFTGIIESTATIINLQKDQSNLQLTFQNELTSKFKVDQSISHNGVCLTIVAIDGLNYTVTAIQETLDKTSLSEWKVGDAVNIERAMKIDARLDGHIVQGHVDQIATCTKALEKDGSWEYTFEYEEEPQNVTIEKGSICINGVSLTVVNSNKNSFSVAIIPYTYEHTNFKKLKVGSLVNLEFDVIGKYVKRLMNL